MIGNDTGKKTGVILLNWNGGEFTLPCIASLKAGSIKPDHIVVVDNASSDDSPEKIAQAHPDITLLAQKENLGFAGGNNIGIRYLLDKRVDYIWILNNDTVVKEDCLEQMLRHLEAHPAIDGVSGKIYYENPSDTIWYAGGKLRPWRCSSMHIGLGEKVGPAVSSGPQENGSLGTANPTLKKQFDQTQSIDFLCGCSMFLRTTALKQTGGFHEAFFAYCEDTEWSYRAKNAGLHFDYVPSAILWHKVSASIKKHTLGENQGHLSAQAHYLNIRNRIFNIKLHAPTPLHKASAYISTFLYFTYLSSGLILRRRKRKLASLQKGLRDGLRQKIESATTLS